VGEFDGHMGQYGFPRGGMGSVAEALAARARARGVKIRTAAPVERILVERGAATGVLLSDGEEVPAGAVLSGVDPKRTFLGMLEPGDLPEDFRAAIGAFDMRGSMARVHIALDGIPDFVGMESGAGPHCRGLTLLGGEMERFEGAWAAQRQGRLAEDFPVEFLIQSAHDDSLAPAGKHMLMTGVQQLPFELAEGDWDQRKDEFTERVLDVVSRYAPRLRDHVIDTHTITPLDLEREYGLTGGNIFHGGMTFGQVFGGRPAIGWSDYRTPVAGLYLCGSGAHPGGGVMGVPGHNAAHAVAADLAGAPPPRSAGRRPPERGNAVEWAMRRPRLRRALVGLARRPELSSVLARASRR
jgi:phytoene dehydrogenase-like protein